MPKLHVVSSDGKMFDLSLAGQKITIGRSKKNDLVLNDNTASRHHAEILPAEEGYVLKDLGSFNGTTLNSRSIQREQLADGDVVEIGLTKMTFIADNGKEDTLVESLEIDAEIGLEPEEQPKIVGSSPQTSSAGSEELLVASEQPRGSSAGDLAISGAHPSDSLGARNDKASLERANKVLYVLYEISRQMNTIHDFNELLKKIMDLIFDVIAADSGFLILRDDDDPDKLIPVVEKIRDDKRQEVGKLKASRTIINKVICDQVALLTTNAMDDSRLDFAKSVFMQQIRSAMCAPLWNKDKIIGVIQLDSLSLDSLFTQDDLELLKAIGSQMAMVLEQQTLNKQIREEEDMRKRLERFHSPQVVEMLLHGGQETKDNIMDPKEVTATILFTDIIGFTSLSETMPPREINMILNQYFSRMTDIVFDHDGTLDKYIGDGLMAVFGAPMQKSDDAARAIRAAQDMRKELEKLQNDLEEGRQINIRIGINTGRVVAGNIGSPRRLEYTVIGDPVNTASRLESIAQPNQILIGEETCRLVEGQFDIREVGARKVKGKTAEVQVYEVL